MTLTLTLTLTLMLMLLVPIPFARRVWARIRSALPFLTVLAPSARYYEQRGRAAMKLTDVMRQALLQVRRWLPTRKLAFVADSSYACLALLHRMVRLPQAITMVVRFRLDAALYEPAPIRRPGQRGRTRVKGNRLPTLAHPVAHTAATTATWTSLLIPSWYGQASRRIEVLSDTAVWYRSGMPVVPLRWVVIRDPLGKFKTQALLCTDLNATPLQIVVWFIQRWQLRWQLEVTLREVREHLGVETQRQWTDLAIARTTPALMGLYSLIVVLAHGLAKRGHLVARQTAWYAKPVPTFRDALAAVRQALWRQPTFHVSRSNRHIAKLPQAVFNRFAEALCYST